MKPLVELQKEYAERTKSLLTDVEAHKNPNGTYRLDNVKTIAGKDVSDLGNRAKLDEIWKEVGLVSDLHKDCEKLADIERKTRDMKRNNLPDDDDPSLVKPPDVRASDVFFQNVMKAVRKVVGRPGQWEPVEMKTLGRDAPNWNTKPFGFVGGYDPEVTRTGRITMLGYEQPSLLSVFPRVTTTQQAVKFMEEVTRDDGLLADHPTTGTQGASGTEDLAARTIHEGALYPEDNLRFREREAPIEKIGTTMTITEELLEDEPMMRSMMEQRLPQRLDRLIDRYVVYGSAAVTTGNSNDGGFDDRRPGFGGLERMGALTGNAQGHATLSGMQTLAKTADDNVPNLIHLGFVRVMTRGWAMPGPVLMNPVDWHNIVTLQTADGQYLWANPASGDPGQVIWGHPVVVNQNIVEGTGYTGDFSGFSQWVDRIGMEVGWGFVNDQWKRDIRTIKIRCRAGIVFYRPAAFMKFTGLNT